MPASVPKYHVSTNAQKEKKKGSLAVSPTLKNHEWTGEGDATPHPVGSYLMADISHHHLQPTSWTGSPIYEDNPARPKALLMIASTVYSMLSLGLF